MAACAAEKENAADAQALLSQLRKIVADMLQGHMNPWQGRMSPWCAICGAEAAGWRYELGRTRFTTIAEAKPTFEEEARANELANRLFGSHGSTRPRPN